MIASQAWEGCSCDANLVDPIRIDERRRLVEGCYVVGWN